MTKDEILADLRAVYGRQVILSPADIAIAIGRSPKAQANMRSRGVFPIPIKRAGGKVGVSVYDLADYLAAGAPSTETAASVNGRSPVAPSPAPASATAAAAATDHAPAKPSKPADRAGSMAEPWLPARRRKSFGPELLGFRQALDFWSAVHAELEAADFALLIRSPAD